MNEHDRDLLMLLGTIGTRISHLITGLFEDNLSPDEQLDFAHQLTQLADGFRHRVQRTPLVIEGETVS